LGWGGGSPERGKGGTTTKGKSKKDGGTNRSPFKKKIRVLGREKGVGGGMGSDELILPRGGRGIREKREKSDKKNSRERVSRRKKNDNQ